MDDNFGASLAGPGSYKSFNMSELVGQALPGLQGNFSVFELTTGTVFNQGNSTLDSGYNLSVTHPTFYITNFTHDGVEGIYNEVFHNITLLAQTLKPMEKVPFVNGAVSLCFVLSGVVTASWMLFLLVLLSSNTIPNSLLLANLFFAISHSVILAKLSKYLETQVLGNMQNIEELRSTVTSSVSYIIIRELSSLLVYISWVDLLAQITKYENRNKILVAGLAMSLFSFAFSVAYNFVFKYSTEETTMFVALKVLHYFSALLVLTFFTLNILMLVVKRRKFAFHRKAIALTIFTILTLTTPYAFTLVDIISDVLRSWCTYVARFSDLCVTVTVWEWLHTIRTLEKKYESKTVLGRRISNDSFLLNDNSTGPNNSNYILKSMNIVAFFTYLNAQIMKFLKGMSHKSSNVLHKVSISESTKAKSKPTNEVTLYELQPAISQQSQNQMSDNISLVGDYPQFNVDLRYLRNTPSTGYNTREPTPATPSNGPTSQS